MFLDFKINFNFLRFYFLNLIFYKEDYIMLRDPIIQNLFPEIFEFEEAVDVIGCLKDWPKSRLCDDKAIARKTKIDIKTVKDILKLLETNNFVYNVKVNEICIKLIKHVRSGKLSHEEMAKKTKLDVKIVDQFIEENESLLLETKKSYSQETLKTLNDNFNALIKGEKKEKEKKEKEEADEEVEEEKVEEKVEEQEDSSEDEKKTINEDKESEEVVVKEAVNGNITITIEATEKSLDNITIAQAPAKVAYETGESFNPAGLQIQLNYTAGASDVVDYSNETKDAFTFSPDLETALAPANTEVTITYGGKSVNQAITVTDPVADRRPADA